MEDEIVCEYCGSNHFLMVKKGTTVVEIVKHRMDCPIIIEILKEGKEHEKMFDSFVSNGSRRA